MTINKFLNDYGVKRGHLEQYGLTFFIQAKYGDTDLDELPEDYKMMFIAVLNRYGFFCEGCHE